MDISGRAPVTGAKKHFYSNDFIHQGDAKDPKLIGGMFEAMFYRMWFQAVREEQEQDPLFSSSEMKYVNQMQDDLFADELGVQGSLGIVSYVEKQMQKEKLYAAKITENA